MQPSPPLRSGTAILHGHIARMARSDPDWQVRLSAVELIADPEVLDQIAAADRSLVIREAAAARCVALTAARGELAIVDLARGAAASFTRTLATRRITNPAMLAQLATSQFDEQVRVAAVAGLTDQQVLCHVAANDTHWEVRLAAVERVSALSTLARVARRDPNDAVRLAAHARLADVDTKPVARQLFG